MGLALLKYKGSKGSSILDVSASLIIFSVSFLGTSQLLLLSMNTSDQSLQHSHASWMAESILARMAVLRDMKQDEHFSYSFGTLAGTTSSTFQARDCQTTLSPISDPPVPSEIEQLAKWHLAAVFCGSELEVASASDNMAILGWSVACEPTGCQDLSPVTVTIEFMDFSTESVGTSGRYVLSRFI